MTEFAPKPATAHTAAANIAFGAGLPLDDPSDADRATRGFVAAMGDGAIRNAQGRVVWDTTTASFLDADCPDTVNPSLWRQARLNRNHGLFEVADGVWQVRGHDISNVTFVAGATGWLVIDPLTTEETARASLALLHAHVPARPVRAVIYSHSHVDHFGGVRGVVDEADVRAGRVRIIAPEGFMAETVAENVVAGPAMLRRASYMFGLLLPPGPRGHVDAGLGRTTPLGTVGLIAPTEEVTATGTELVVDGIRVVFQLTPGTEAPAEMNFHFPDKRLLCMAENCSHNMHNLYTLRGAQVRDALGWSKYIHEAIGLFGDDTDVLFASHHWPRFGHDDAIAFLEAQRDAYRWVHDQTMRLANHGLTALEIAEQLDLPADLAHTFHVRGYYGTVNHNVKAVYQRYLGWFDANPANLHPLPPVEASAHYVEYMGGADAVLARARRDFEAGHYRWVAQVVNHVVFADPANVEARALQADTLEQLGYQCESGPWRGFYLTGAQELRPGAPNLGVARPVGLMGAMTVTQLFDAIGVRLNGPAVAGQRATVNWRFTDIGEDHTLGLAHGTLHHTPGRLAAAADVTVTLTHAAFVAVLMGDATFVQQVAGGEVVVEGDPGALRTIFGNLDTFARGFAIVEP